MAKRNEFPDSKHIVPRIQAIIDANSAARNVLSNLKSFKKELTLPDVVWRHIDEALDKLRISTQAICGDDEED